MFLGLKQSSQLWERSRDKWWRERGRGGGCDGKKTQVFFNSVKSTVKQFKHLCMHSFHFSLMLVTLFILHLFLASTYRQINITTWYKTKGCLLFKILLYFTRGQMKPQTAAGCQRSSQQCHDKSLWHSVIASLKEDLYFFTSHMSSVIQSLYMTCVVKGFFLSYV